MHFYGKSQSAAEAEETYVCELVDAAMRPAATMESDTTAEVIFQIQD